MCLQILDKPHPAPSPHARRPRRTFMTGPLQERFPSPTRRAPASKYILGQRDIRDFSSRQGIQSHGYEFTASSSQGAFKATHLLRHTRTHSKVLMISANTNKANEDQHVPARPAADQQNTKDNSCHTLRTKAAEAIQSEFMAAIMHIGNHAHKGRWTYGRDFGHDCP